jgi:hypothetical protein
VISFGRPVLDTLTIINSDMQGTSDMMDLIPRFVDEMEAKRLGVEHGWYGTRVNGTFMTGSCATQDACLEAIGEIPEPATKVAPPGTEKSGAGKGKLADGSIYKSYTQLSAIRVGYKPSRQGKR